MTAVRRIWLCADDYGIAPGVNGAIRDLAANGRLNATSVMTLAPAVDASEVAALAALNDGTRRVAIGLHVTLTAPFRPLSAGFRPLHDGTFLPLGRMLLQGMLGRLDRAALVREVESQMAAFQALFGRPPDFVDGHQHVHHFPQVRDAVLAVVKTRAPRAWVRQCGNATPLWRRPGDLKAMLLDALARGFRRRALTLGIATNPAFAGTYDFAVTPAPDFAALFPDFLHGMPDGGLVMCHPGFVDDTLRTLDPLTDQREREHAFFAGSEFPEILERHRVALIAPPAT
jgi:predicted glycoside hydrolase/deacetylase ChbG (UPF0249 family)